MWSEGLEGEDIFPRPRELWYISKMSCTLWVVICSLVQEGLCIMWLSQIYSLIKMHALQSLFY